MKRNLGTLPKKSLPQITKSSKIWEVGRMLLDKNLTCCPVIENRRAMGLIFQRDIALASLLNGGLGLEVEEIMESRFLRLSKEFSLEKALNEFITANAQWGIVEDDKGRFSNMLSVTEVLSATQNPEEGVS